MSNKPKNVAYHWHYFPKDLTNTDDNRVDICELEQKRADDPLFTVWILETDVCINFMEFNDAFSFVKDFILGRHARVAVDMNNDPI